MSPKGLPAPPPYRVKAIENSDAELVRSLELSTPHYDKERVYPGLAKQKVDKKDRHMQAVEAFAKLLDSVAAGLESDVLLISRGMRETVEGIDSSLKEWYAKLDDENFLKEQLEKDLIVVRETQLKHIVQQRSVCVEQFADDLDGLERRRADTIGSELKLLVDRLIAIAHQLPNEIERIVESETFDLNVVLTSNRKSHAELMGLLRKKQIEVEVEALQVWENSREKWRAVRHKQALGAFAVDINGPKYTDPDDRVQFMESVKARQRERHSSRQQQIAVLQGLSAANISSSTILNAQGKLAALGELEVVDISDCARGMGELKALLSEEAARRVEVLRQELHSYGALHKEPDFKALTVVLEAALGAPALAELWRLGGGLKPEVQSLVADMGSGDVVYDGHVCSIRDRLAVVCSGFPLRAVLEERGRPAGLDKVRNLVVKLRASPRGEVPALLSALLAELDELLQLPGTPEVFNEVVRGCVGEMQVELQRVASYRPATEAAGAPGFPRTASSAAPRVSTGQPASGATTAGATTAGSKRGRSAATAGGEKDASIVDPSLVKQWNRRLGIVFFASDLPHACQDACLRSLSGSQQQLECNAKVDAVVTDVSAATLRRMELSYARLITSISAFLEAQTQYATLCGNNLCEFFLCVARKVEAHRKQQAALDERNADELWDLSEDFRLGREDAEALFKDRCQTVRESVNLLELQANFEQVLGVLEDVQKSYRTYHGKGCLAADKHPLTLADEFKTYTADLAESFRMSPDADHALIAAYHRIFDQTVRLNRKFFDADPGAGGVEPRPVVAEPAEVAEPAVEGEEGEPMDAPPPQTAPRRGAGQYARLNASAHSLSGTFTMSARLEELVASLTEEKSGAEGDEVAPPPGTGVFVREGSQAAPWILKDAQLQPRSEAALAAMDDLERESYEDSFFVSFLPLSADSAAELPEELQAAYAEAAALFSAVSARKAREGDPAFLRANPPMHACGDSWVLPLEITTAEMTSLVASIREEVVASVEAEAYDRLAAAEARAVERKEAFTSELEDRLRTHWPRRGRVETQIKQPREAELLGHEEKTWRYIQTIQSKAYEVQKRFAAAVSSSRDSCDKYVNDMTALRNLLGGTYRNLAALQGIDARARTCTIAFQGAAAAAAALLKRVCEEDAAAVVAFALDFRKVCPRQTPGEEGGYSETELREIEQLVAGQCEEIHGLVEEWRRDIAAVAELQQQSLKSQAEFSQRYDKSAQDLAMSEGLGQRYGAPRRRAQERLRTAVSRDEASAGRVDELLAKLDFLSREARRSAGVAAQGEDASADKAPEDAGNGRKELDAVHELWTLLTLLRAAFQRRVLCLRVADAPPLVDLPFPDRNRIPALQAAEVSELDSVGAEDDAVAPAATETLEDVLDEAEGTCRRETRELYEGEGCGALLGAGGVPEALQQWLAESREKMLGQGGHRVRAWKRLWAQVGRFEAATGRRLAGGEEPSWLRLLARAWRHWRGLSRLTRATSTLPGTAGWRRSCCGSRQLATRTSACCARGWAPPTWRRSWPAWIRRSLSGPLGCASASASSGAMPW